MLDRSYSESASDLLQQHALVHERLRSLAAARLDRGRHEEAAVYTQAVAEHAWMNHPGVFVDRRLEELVGRLAREVLVTTPASRPDPEPASVLHVLTQAYELWGHTRLCWRWIETDFERRHSVVLTQQDRHPIPDALTNAVAAAGGRLCDLSVGPAGLVERAQSLRDLAGEHDAVVLHVHPYEVVSAIAFALPGPVPVLFLNHADHVFWLGACSADLFVHIRDKGVALAAARRAVHPERSAVLPIPIPGAFEADGSRDRTRRELGIGADELMLLTIGSPYKYGDGDNGGFLARVVPALADIPNVKLVAVGPSHAGPWAAAQAATGGRVLALGVQRDLRPLVEAADAYIDSFPLGSGTALLEAGAAGLPLCRLAQPGQWHETFELGDPFLDPHLIDAHDAQALREQLAALAEDPAARRELGARTREAVMAGHVGAEWRQQVAGVYLRAAAIAGEPRAAAPDVQRAGGDALDLGLTGINAGGDSHAAFLRRLPAHVRPLPPRAAARMAIAFAVAMREDVRRVRPVRFVRAAARGLARRGARSTAP